MGMGTHSCDAQDAKKGSGSNFNCDMPPGSNGIQNVDKQTDHALLQWRYVSSVQHISLD